MFTFCILDLCDQANLGEARDVLVDSTSAAQACYLRNERRRNELMILAALFNLRRT